ncbi:MAG: Holliday junction branch migration protein RuvA [Spirochaetes bacterium]|nr:Holliday junction branch migration protein RuvA [Spirochaetota bacterium]
MIGSLKGSIQKLKTSSLIIDVSGVGYFVSISLNTYYNLADKQTVFLYIYTYIKEDKFDLYGFLTEEEKDIFKVLISVTGVGPSLALAILSGMSFTELLNVIRNRDVAMLTKIPGIGKTKAEKILLDLQSKTKKLNLQSSETISGGNPFLEDAVEALVALGFEERKSRTAVADCIGSKNPEDLQEIIKGSLKLL